MLPSDPSQSHRFFVESVLGEGATSRVFAVRDLSDGSRFALKRLRSDSLSPERVARFKDEFRALEHMSHPNLAKVYELLGHDREVSLVMELVEGDDFVSYVRRDAKVERQPTSSNESDATEAAPSAVGGTLDVARLREVLPQLVRGVCALHQLGKIHCDIKPENVLVTPSCRLVIVDFGLVTDAVRADHWRGTPAFMAPEQFDGVFDEAVDWYAVGMLLYVALCGRCYVTSTTASALLARRVRIAPSNRVSPRIPPVT